MLFSEREVLEVVRMVEMEHLDIRAVTMSLSIRDCADPSVEKAAQKIRDKVKSYTEKLVSTCDQVAGEFGIPVVNKRLSVTPVSIISDALESGDPTPLAVALDEAAGESGIDYVGGYGALVHKGFTKGDVQLVKSIPQALAATSRVCSSVNVASTKSGINMDAVYLMSGVIKEAAQNSADQGGIHCARLVVFCNIPEDNPFIAGACTGIGEPECALNVGVSGPGVVRAALSKLDKKAPLVEMAELFKQLAFKITRAGELVGKEVASRLGVPFGIVDLSLAPTPAVGDSIADILEAMGLESTGAPGTTAALAMLTDSVKKGGAMAGSYVGGLSGAFIPISEDQGMIRAAQKGALTLEKMEAMTSVCSVGLDMIAVPGDTSVETLSGLIADEMAIGMINKKTTAVRVIPVPGKEVGDLVEFGGLLGSAYVMAVNPHECRDFVRRAGRIPPPIQALTN